MLFIIVRDPGRAFEFHEPPIENDQPTSQRADDAWSSVRGWYATFPKLNTSSLFADLNWLKADCSAG